MNAISILTAIGVLIVAATCALIIYEIFERRAGPILDHFVAPHDEAVHGTFDYRRFEQ